MSASSVSGRCYANEVSAPLPVSPPVRPVEPLPGRKGRKGQGRKEEGREGEGRRSGVFLSFFAHGIGSRR